MLTSLPASVTKITTMRDKTVRLQIDCQEIAPENMTELFALNDTLGYFYFQEQPIKEVPTKDLPEINLEPHQKSPGQRLHAVLYLLHKQNGGKDEDFDPFYRYTMEKIISDVKEILN